MRLRARLSSSSGAMNWLTPRMRGDACARCAALSSDNCLYGFDAPQCAFDCSRVEAILEDAGSSGVVPAASAFTAQSGRQSAEGDQLIDAAGFRIDHVGRSELYAAPP